MGGASLKEVNLFIFSVALNVLLQEPEVVINIASSILYKFDRYVNSQRPWHHVQDLYKFKWGKNLNMEVEKWTQILLLTKKLFAVNSLMKRMKPASLLECHLVYKPHTRVGLTPRRIWPVQMGLHIVFVLFVLLWYFLSYWVFCLFWFLFIYLFIFWETTWSWVGREMRRIWGRCQWRGRNAIDMYKN